MKVHMWVIDGTPLTHRVLQNISDQNSGALQQFNKTDPEKLYQKV